MKYDYIFSINVNTGNVDEVLILQKQYICRDSSF